MRSPAPAAAILAGGQARRFDGRDKSRLLVEGRPIIVRQVEVLRQVAGVVFVVGGDARRFADLGLTVYPDDQPGLGAIGGLLTALECAEADRVVVVACDLPFLHAGLLSRLVDRAAEADAAWVETARGPEPLVGCYRREARHAVRAAIAGGHLALQDLRHVLRVAPVGPDEVAAFGPIDRLLANLNSLADVERIESDPLAE
jgi:molybdopterin-guanine dinucleotide biosynthesis protein A